MKVFVLILVALVASLAADDLAAARQAYNRQHSAATGADPAELQRFNGPANEPTLDGHQSGANQINSPEIECGKVSNAKALSARLLVAGGEPADPDSHPWLAIIEIKRPEGYRLFRHGVLIDNQSILTDNCTAKAHDLRVKLGVHDRNEEDFPPVFMMKVLEVIRDDSSSLTILKLDSPVNFLLFPNGYGSINRICKPALGELPSEGDLMTLTGWGERDSSPKTAKLVYVSDRQCKKWMPSKFNRHQHICVKPLSGGQCDGDQGAPLTRKVGNQHLLVGLASIKAAVCNDNLPEIYVSAAKNINWVNEQLKQSG